MVILFWLHAHKNADRAGITSWTGSPRRPAGFSLAFCFDSRFIFLSSCEEEKAKKNDDKKKGKKEKTKKVGEREPDLACSPFLRVHEGRLYFLFHRDLPQHAGRWTRKEESLVCEKANAEPVDPCALVRVVKLSMSSNVKLHALTCPSWPHRWRLFLHSLREAMAPPNS